jgi:hypothetical protein
LYFEKSKFSASIMKLPAWKPVIASRNWPSFAWSA